MGSSYTLEDYRKLADNVHFFRVKIDKECISGTLREIFDSLSELSWILKFDEDYLRASYEICAKKTIEHISKKFFNRDGGGITKDSGEYVVSEISRKVIIENLNYLDVPLAELIKAKIGGNPGFDFYSENNDRILLFGEAKYKSTGNAYGYALKQIDEFIRDKKDIIDVASIKPFVSEESLSNVCKGNKGYIAAFSSTDIETEVLIRNIQNNSYYKILSLHKELVCVAVTI